MGGEGSIAGMITALKNNSKILGKRQSFFNRDNKIHDSIKTKHRIKDLHKFSEEERIELIQRLRKERKIENIKKVTLLIFLLALFTVLGILFM